MPSGVEQEFERHKRRCRKLHEDFLQRRDERDEERAALLAIDGEVAKLQGRGVSLLGELNVATREGDERKVKAVQSSYDKFSRELSRAQDRRERISGKLAEVEFDDVEVTQYIMRAGQKQVEDAENRIQELKDLFGSLLEEQRRQIAQVAQPLSAEYEACREDPDEPEDG